MAERDLVVRIIGDSRSLQREFLRSSRAGKTFEARMTGVSRGVSRALRLAGVTTGLAGVTLALRSVINAAIDFESSFAGVRKTVDATEPQFAALAKGFRTLAKEIPVSVNELNRIGEAAGQLGVQRTAILDFTRTVADLGVTTNISSEQAAEALARIANITRLPQSEFDRLGATIVELGNKLAATESEIVDFGLRIAAAGKIVGLTEAQTLAVAGAFTSVGVEAEAGGTAVSKVLISLANAVESGGKKLELFAQTAGTSTTEFRRQFEQNTAGAFTAFVEGLRRVDEEGGNVFQLLKDLGLTDVRLTRAFLSISQGGDLLARSLQIGTRAWRENSALTEEAARRYETTASKLQLFRNRVNDLQITLGEVLAPALLNIVTPLEEWAEKTENQEKLQRGLTQALEDAQTIIKGVAGVVVPLARALRSAAESTVGLRRAVEALLVAMVVGKVIGFGTAIAGIGPRAAASTVQVNALRTALLRLGAIGVITVGVEIILNRKAIDDFVRSRVPGFLGGIDPIKLSLQPEIRLEQLRDLRRKLVDLVGPAAEEVRELDKIIANVLRRLQEAQTTRPDDRPGARGPGAIAAENKRLAAEERRANALAAAAARAIAEAEGDITEEKKKGAKATKDTASATQKLIDLERERLRIVREQRQGRQFRALGLTSEGLERIPSAKALQARVGTLRDQLKGTVLDTERTRSQLRRIAKVLSGAFGAVGRDVREAILGMIQDISRALGGEDISGGPQTAAKKVRINALLDGLGLSEDEVRALRSRLSQITGTGRVRGGGPSLAAAAAGFGGGLGGALVIQGGTFNFHGIQNVREFEAELQQRVRRRGGSRAGVRPGGRSGLA